MGYLYLNPNMVMGLHTNSLARQKKTFQQLKPTSLTTWTSKLPSCDPLPNIAITFLMFIHFLNNSNNYCSLISETMLLHTGHFLTLKSSRRSPKAVEEERCTTESCFLSCFKLPLQSPTAGCGDFEILSILKPPEWYTLPGRHDANETIPRSDKRACRC